MPHCAPPCSRNAFCNGCSSPWRARPFDSLDFRSFGLQNWNQATVHKFTIHAHGTGAALAFAASLLGPGQLQIFAQYVEKALHRRNFDSSCIAIHTESNRGPPFAENRTFALAHRAAISSAGWAAARPAYRSSGRSGIALNATPVALRIAFRIAGAGPS